MTPSQFQILALCGLVGTEVVLRKGSWGPRLLNLQLYLVNSAVLILVMPLLSPAIPFSLIDGPVWLTVPLFIVAMDLTQFFYHRIQHAVPFLWRFHTVHHSDDDINATTAYRAHWVDAIGATLFSTVLTSLLVKPSATAIILYGILAVWIFATHSAVDFSFGRLSWLVSSSAYHRLHHSRLPEHYDTNFAGLFPIFDVICGTYRRPSDPPPTGLSWKPRHIGHAISLPPKLQ